MLLRLRNLLVEIRRIDYSEQLILANAIPNVYQPRLQISTCSRIHIRFSQRDRRSWQYQPGLMLRRR